MRKVMKLTATMTNAVHRSRRRMYLATFALLAQPAAYSGGLTETEIRTG